MKYARRQDETAALNCVVLTGTGSAFSASILRFTLPIKGSRPQPGARYHANDYSDAVLALPLGRLVNGHALGGGFVLMRRPVAGNDTIRLGLTEAQNAVSAAGDLATQPAFKIVKRQVCGALQAELQRFAADGVDPFLTSFG
jgi:hypothetical protein